MVGQLERGAVVEGVGCVGVDDETRDLAGLEEGDRLLVLLLPSPEDLAELDDARLPGFG